MLMKFVRLLRKKLILILIFSISLLYCLYNFTKDRYITENSTMSVNVVKGLPQIDSFRWNSETKNDTVARICRNSVQGKVFLADDQGYVCHRIEVLPNGCCNSDSASTKRYVCDTCFEDGCCTIYEHCLSCCLHPNKKAILENIFVKFHPGFRFILSAVKDQYELCSAKCRTSSYSVQHENSYRNPDRKYCYQQLLSSDGT